MSSVVFVKKTPAGGAGNFIYEYKCTCSSGTAKPNVTVTCANDNEARQLAELECDDSCGESLVAGQPATALQVLAPFKMERTPTVAPTGDLAGGFVITPSSVSPTPGVSVQGACISFYAVDNPSLVGIRNGCSECKVAVVNWSGVGILYYKVPAYTTGVIVRQSSNGQIIGENPC